MVLTFSAVLIFGIALAALLKSRALGGGSAFVAVMFGFFLAATGAAPVITQFVTNVAHALNTIGH
ncbi:hypothetical protein POF50_019635 [Streptomyces sp. SL13]|uniref:Uncharacterized protein n=1 Tax=Streptantibioticus silvisoli TaxID=2705255 RepID=A0AA90H1D1_9ACTN|nr:hypothetical protein [Streptantibioticus silvisoli]MDI5971514.1 hypothetical protein [Streptantibioticus silvisoli]